MAGLSHQEIWNALDALAERFDLTPSALAKLAGLDPTSFNRSKRTSGETPTRPRWPSTESLAKVLEATGVTFAEFATLAEGGPAPHPKAVPLIGFSQAGSEGFFDAAGFPVGLTWDEVDFPGMAEDGSYALEITGDALAPVYRDGDRIVVNPAAEPRRGDRVVIKTVAGEVLAMEIARITSRTIALNPLSAGQAERTMERKDLAWIARILWASQ